MFLVVITYMFLMSDGERVDFRTEVRAWSDTEAKVICEYILEQTTKTSIPEGIEKEVTKCEPTEDWTS
jgi:hypothetical protein